MGETRPHCVWNIATELGEGPVWVAAEKAVYFVDILGCAIHRRQENGDCKSWETPAEPGFIYPRRGGGFICGLRGGLYLFDPARSNFTLFVHVDQDKPHHRINDGLVDALGRVWFGTMNDDTRTPGGMLYSVEDDRTLRVHDIGYVVANGPAISPDGRTLYHTDSAARTVYAFELSAEGRLSNKRTFLNFPDGVYPDGMAVDEAGALWIALFNGWRVERFSPQGEKLGEIRFPCANVTKPAFGGNDRRTLYVTTARTGLTPEARKEQLLAGGLFAVNVQTPGLAVGLTS